MDNRRRNGCSAAWIYCPSSSSFLCSFLSHGWPEYSSLDSLGVDAKLMTWNSFHFILFLIFCCQLLFGCLWFYPLPSPVKARQSFHQQQFNNIQCDKKNLFNRLIFTKQILSDIKGIQMPVLLAVLLTAVKK